MKNLLNFFFSFEKLFKEKLVVPFFWLALIVAGLGFFAEALDSISLDPLAKLIQFIGFFAEIFLVLVSIRIVAEIIVAIFRINDNLSPDGGKGELADIDPVAEARRAAEMAAHRTREMTKTGSGSKADTATETSPKTDRVVATPAATSMVKASSKTPSTEGATPKRGRGRPKGSKNKSTAATASKSSASERNPSKSPSADSTKSDGQPVKRGRGRPKGSKNKPKPAGATGRSKPGPKPGTKVRRDADGNLLKKDGTPRKKPGPKPKS
jgi:high mobility group AT-hook protein 2